LKKLIVLFCVLAVIMAMPATAFAETEPAALVVGVTQVDSELYDAKAVEVASSVTMMIPEDMTATTEGDVTTLTDGVHTIEIVSQDADESAYSSLDDAKKAFIEEGLQRNMVEMTINGVPALGVVMTDGTYMVLLQTTDGRIITVKFLNFSTADDEYKAWVENMVKSIVVESNPSEDRIKELSRFTPLTSSLPNLITMRGLRTWFNPLVSC